NSSDPFGLCPGPDGKDDGKPCSASDQLQAKVDDMAQAAMNWLGDLGNSMMSGLRSLGKEAAIQGGIALVTEGLGTAAEAGAEFTRIAGPARDGMQVVLQEFLGQKAAGAEARLASRTLTPGVTKEMLTDYANRVAGPILAGTAPAEKITAAAIAVQSARMRLINAALAGWPK
ncbi:MAG: hypothetical protein ACREN6_06980, partial [Gemmatimonadaceae bacterium]